MLLLFYFSFFECAISYYLLAHSLILFVSSGYSSWIYLFIHLTSMFIVLRMCTILRQNHTSTGIVFGRIYYISTIFVIGVRNGTERNDGEKVLTYIHTCFLPHIRIMYVLRHDFIWDGNTEYMEGCNCIIRRKAEIFKFNMYERYEFLVYHIVITSHSYGKEASLHTYVCECDWLDILYPMHSELFHIIS